MRGLEEQKSIRQLCHEINDNNTFTPQNLEVRRAADELINMSHGKSGAAPQEGLNSNAVMFPDSEIFFFHHYYYCMWLW